jgi:Lon-like ATP-dependent protease
VAEKTGLVADKLKFNDETFYQIMKGWCYYEGGVREMGRCLEKISRKYVLEIL